MLYAFQLGRQADLSLAELVQVFKNKAKLISFDQKIALFESEQILPKEFDLLGGCIKYGVVVPVKREDLLKEVFDTILHIAKRQDSNRFRFGFSLYKANQATLEKKIEFIRGWKQKRS